jgi:hypothetical protein
LAILSQIISHDSVSQIGDGRISHCLVIWRVGSAIPE